jgi:DNA-binding NarL/FixJ family response regulator
MLEGAGLGTVVAEVEDGIEAIAQTRALNPDLLMLDVAMPGEQGTVVLNEVKRWSPQTCVIVCTGLTGAGLLNQLIAGGVDGLFMKRGDPQHLIGAIPEILDGKRIISPDIQKILRDRSEASELTPRELQVLQLLVDGLSNRDAGEKLGVSAKTVDNHKTNLMRKLGVHSQAQLLAFALREGLIDASKEL